jgi:hypothetical protein
MDAHFNVMHKCANVKAEERLRHLRFSWGEDVAVGLLGTDTSKTEALCFSLTFVSTYNDKSVLHRKRILTDLNTITHYINNLLAALLPTLTSWRAIYVQSSIS